MENPLIDVYLENVVLFVTTVAISTKLEGTVRRKNTVNLTMREKLKENVLSEE